jgi:hypothetical protein
MGFKQQEYKTNFQLMLNFLPDSIENKIKYKLNEYILELSGNQITHVYSPDERVLAWRQYGPLQKIWQIG